MIGSRIQRIGMAMLLAIPFCAHGQLFEPASHAKGGGGWQDCNASLEIDFQDTLTDYLTYRFTPVITPGSNLVANTVWSYYDGTFQQSFEDTLVHQFPIPGEHFVCLTANAFDLNTQQPCTATRCRPVEILQDDSCAYLVVDFTIAGIDGGSITFEDQSTFPNGIASMAWSFGDAGSSIATQPTQFFDDPGPHQVCLTVVGNGSVGCTATVCKWLYLGPAPVECDVLLDPGFLFLQQDALVGVLDTSITSGAFSSVEWDFGDGSVASGAWAVHGYEWSGVYSLCSTVRLWGPLAADTCVNTQCITVVVMDIVGLDDTYEDHSGPLAYPVPFTDRLMLTGLDPMPSEVRVIDAMGRIVHSARSIGSGLVLELGHIGDGAYILQVQTPGDQRAVRVLKE